MNWLQRKIISEATKKAKKKESPIIPGYCFVLEQENKRYKIGTDTVEPIGEKYNGSTIILCVKVHDKNKAKADVKKEFLKNFIEIRSDWYYAFGSEIVHVFKSIFPNGEFIRDLEPKDEISRPFSFETFEDLMENILDLTTAFIVAINSRPELVLRVLSSIEITITNLFTYPELKERPDFNEKLSLMVKNLRKNKGAFEEKIEGLIKKIKDLIKTHNLTYVKKNLEKRFSTITSAFNENLVHNGLSEAYALQLHLDFLYVFSVEEFKKFKKSVITVNRILHNARTFSRYELMEGANPNDKILRNSITKVTHKFLESEYFSFKPMKINNAIYFVIEEEEDTFAKITCRKTFDEYTKELGLTGNDFSQKLQSEYGTMSFVEIRKKLFPENYEFVALSTQGKKTYKI